MTSADFEQNQPKSAKIKPFQWENGKPYNFANFCPKILIYPLNESSTLVLSSDKISKQNIQISIFNASGFDRWYF